MLVFFLPMFNFCKKMYSQNDETDVLEVLEIIFCCPIMVSRPLQFFFKILSWISQFGSGIFVIYLKIDE